MAPQVQTNAPPLTPHNHSLTEDGVKVLIVTIALTLLATLSVLARLWARHVNNRSWKPTIEDWLVMGALVFTWGYGAGNIICKLSHLAGHGIIDSNENDQTPITDWEFNQRFSFKLIA